MFQFLYNQAVSDFVYFVIVVFCWDIWLEGIDFCQAFVEVLGVFCMFCVFFDDGVDFLFYLCVYSIVCQEVVIFQ